MERSNCPKCGGWAPVHYRGADRMVPGNEECLVHKCMACGYRWETPCKDACEHPMKSASDK